MAHPNNRRFKRNRCLNFVLTGCITVGCNKRSELHPTTTPWGYGGHGFGSPSYSLRRDRLSRPRDRMSSERRWAMDGPPARAVGQVGEPKEPDVSRANKRGWPFFWWLFFGHAKKSYSPRPEGRAKPPSRPTASCPARQSRAIHHPHTTKRKITPDG